MAQALQQATRSVITLKGSTAIVTEFFEFAVSSILFQRGIYPAEYFHGAKKYGMTVMLAEQEDLDQYLKNIAEQMQFWVEKGQLQKVSLVLISAVTDEVLEQWTFKVETDHHVVEGAKSWPEKADKDIHKEISAIIRQITSTITFLPLIDEPCRFDLLLFTDQDAHVPETWADSEERPIQNASEIMLRAFSTKVHSVAASVAYKNVESDEDDAVSEGNPVGYGMAEEGADAHAEGSSDVAAATV
eukprot:jgi/Ulvmu1/2384/UM130_0017.1